MQIKCKTSYVYIILYYRILQAILCVTNSLMKAVTFLSPLKERLKVSVVLFVGPDPCHTHHH